MLVKDTIEDDLPIHLLRQQQDRPEAEEEREDQIGKVIFLQDTVQTRYEQEHHDRKGEEHDEQRDTAGIKRTDRDTHDDRIEAIKAIHHLETIEGQ